MQVTYEGPHDAVEVPALGRTVKRGEPVKVDKTLGARLLEQDAWKPVTAQTHNTEEQ